MKNKFFIAALAFMCILLNPIFSIGQNGNFKPLPVTDANGVFTNATITINDFIVEDDEVYVASTLNAIMFGSTPVSFPAFEKVTILSSSCDGLIMFLGPETVSISGYNFNIGNFIVTLNKKYNDQSLNNTLCSIAHLQIKNASPYTMVAKLKQLIRAFN